MDEQRIFEYVSVQFARVIFCDFYEFANLQPMRDAAFLAGVI